MPDLFQSQDNDEAPLSPYGPKLHPLKRTLRGGARLHKSAQKNHTLRRAAFEFHARKTTGDDLLRVNAGPRSRSLSGNAEYPGAGMPD